jgi:hypothetical protein
VKRRKPKETSRKVKRENQQLDGNPISNEVPGHKLGNSY